MTFWIKKINWLRVFLSGLVYTIIAMIVHQIEAMLTMKYYLDPQYFGVWSKLMMPSNGPPPISFFITSLIITLVTGICITVVYYYIKDMLPQNIWRRTFFFADLMMGTYFIFFSLPAYLMFNLPIGLLISWFLSSFIILVGSATAMVRIVK